MNRKPITKMQKANPAELAYGEALINTLGKLVGEYSDLISSAAELEMWNNLTALEEDYAYIYALYNVRDAKRIQTVTENAVSFLLGHTEERLHPFIKHLQETIAYNCKA